MVRVRDARVIERRLEPLRVRPRVLAAAHAAALSDVDQQPNVCIPK
jgi:hypothetical protein